MISLLCWINRVMSNSTKKRSYYQQVAFKATFASPLWQMYFVKCTILNIIKHDNSKKNMIIIICSMQILFTIITKFLLRHLCNYVLLYLLRKKINLIQSNQPFPLKDQFIEIGGAQTLCGLLHSRSERLMNEAIMAISYIVADSENNKSAIIDEDGYVFFYTIFKA